MFRSRHRANYNNRSRHDPLQGRRNGSKIHESKFIKKAVDGVAPAAPFQSSFTFAELSIDEMLKRNIAQCGYVMPTEIQAGTIMQILQGKDVIGIANTGTGKTAAFLIPLLDKLAKNRTQRILIVVPTRELAEQIKAEFHALSNGMNVYSILCIGGSSISRQVQGLRRNPQVVIGTTGRIKDLIQRRSLSLNGFSYIVLDEVDRMLDMGFIHDIRFLITQLPKVKQSLFFSATLSPEIRNLISTLTVDPVMVSVKKQETLSNIEQDIIRVGHGAQKLDVLEQLLKNEEFKKVIIFGRTKWGVEKLSINLQKRGFKADSIHGDKPQFKRSQAIRQFKEDQIKILVATDVASRGIDIADITHVINYDQPATYEDYVHRIGRTGRANKSGIALTFVE